MQISYSENKLSVSEISFDAQLTLMDSAQVFHWKKDENNIFSACVDGKCVQLVSRENSFELNGVNEGDTLFWRNYFDLDRDYSEIAILCTGYPLARQAMELLPGMRVLNQPVWEALLTFILSANNNVSRIRQLVEKLIDRFGENGMFPTPERLGMANEDALRAIGCGYRAPYLIKTAEMVRDGFPLDELRHMSYEAAHKLLLELPGVGDKVADCVQLFGLKQSAAFPVDVWVERLMRCWFVPDVHGKKKIRECAQEMFGMHAGIVQQSLFHCARLGLIPLNEK